MAAGGERASESKVGEVAEAAGDSAGGLDDAVDRFGRSVGPDLAHLLRRYELGRVARPSGAGHYRRAVLPCRLDVIRLDLMRVSALQDLFPAVMSLYPGRGRSW